jgi:SAM-dependent methyltransferase
MNEPSDPDAAWSPAADDAGLMLSRLPLAHRDEEYDPAGLAVLEDMQARHFWYLGRHRFLRYGLETALRRCGRRPPWCLRGIDLGGGCGGWVRYLLDHCPGWFEELALADSSLLALNDAAAVVGPKVKRYQIDLLDLAWSDRWDAAFLLDVLEHIPEDRRVLEQVRQTLRPGGLLLVATPALQAFWSYNDVLSHHVRRYSRQDFAKLAAACGLELLFSRYFMFFLSPLLLLSRLRAPDLAHMSQQQVREHLARTHRVPAWPINQVLRQVFSLEAPLGLRWPFPWGTSVLAVFRRPDRES